MKIEYWQIHFTATPKVIKYCKQCRNKTHFVSSELFRVNAQKKELDIWLIYRCEYCHCTWNLEIYSRIKKQKISPILLEKFMLNDYKLAQKYAMDISFLQAHCNEIAYAPYDIIGSEIDLTQEQNIKIYITCQYRTEIKLIDALRKKLNLSRRQIDHMIETKALQYHGDQDIQRVKIMNEHIITIKIK